MERDRPDYLAGHTRIVTFPNETSADLVTLVLDALDERFSDLRLCAYVGGLDLFGLPVDGSVERARYRLDLDVSPLLRPAPADGPFPVVRPEGFPSLDSAPPGMVDLSVPGGGILRVPDGTTIGTIDEVRESAGIEPGPERDGAGHPIVPESERTCEVCVPPRTFSRKAGLRRHERYGQHRTTSVDLLGVDDDEVGPVPNLDGLPAATLAGISTPADGRSPLERIPLDDPPEVEPASIPVELGTTIRCGKDGCDESFPSILDRNEHRRTFHRQAGGFR